MTTEEFSQRIKRFKTFQEYNQAFDLCIAHLSDNETSALAAETGKKLLKEQASNVLKCSGSNRSITIPLKLNMEWVVDTAIALGYTTLEKGTISTGLFSSCPCITIGSMLAKQKIGIKENRDNTSTLLYSSSLFTSDFKLITALCSDIIDRLQQKYQYL